ncbi:MAG: 4-alpha-glucanotransferase [Brevinema sp.]
MIFKKRASGILCPIFSLPSNEGIGTLGQKAYDFVEFLAQSKQAYWQILPIGITSYGDSPYQSFSSYAGNPYFIDLDILCKEGLLSSDDCTLDWGNKEYVDYEQLWNKKYPLLRKAFQNASFTKTALQTACQQFFWLEDYAIFMALKNHYQGKSRLEWEEGSLKSLVKKELLKSLESEIAFHVFVQVKFYEQWFALKKFANQHQVAIIGDIPIFVANDSADVWADPKYFYLDQTGQSTVVAGVPPDYFSETGQLWGNPLYNWEQLKKDQFSWWIQRIQTNLELFDGIRIDHFRGFESYWSIPYGEETAINGTWIKAYGRELFDLLKKQTKNLPVIAEDLGIITPEVKSLIEDTGFPGMCILQFAFDYHTDNPYKPENIKENRVVYTGTHDNNTSVGWFCDPQNSEQVQHLLHDYFHEESLDSNQFIKRFIEMAWASKAHTAIIPIQDLLGLGTEARINTPATVGDNWKWRLLEIPSYSWLLEITEKYNRD